MGFGDGIFEPACRRERKGARSSESIVESFRLISEYSSVLETCSNNLSLTSAIAAADLLGVAIGFLSSSTS